MLTKKSKYALQALLVLAREYGRGPVLISQVASRESIPRKFLELILLDLKNLGFLGSKKGRGGGYFLARPPAEISIGAVVRHLEGPVAPLPCASETAYQPCEECPDPQACGLRLVMMDVRDSIAGIFDCTSLADVLKREASASAQKGQDSTWQI